MVVACSDFLDPVEVNSESVELREILLSVLNVDFSDPSEPFEVLSNFGEVSVDWSSDPLELTVLSNFGEVLNVDLSSASLDSNVECSSPL